MVRSLTHSNSSPRPWGCFDIQDISTGALTLFPTPVGVDSAKLAELPAQIRARSFFSARVAEAHILDRFRAVSDDYSAGKIGRGEARALLRTFARENKLDDGTDGLKNLASTARLHLILDQNKNMAKAAGDYARMYKPANLKIFPYVRYHASVGSRNPRSSHKQYDGRVFDKRDPWLRNHWPPWDFGCKCELENLTEEEARESGQIVPMSSPETAEKVDNKSGFSFNPEHAFEEYDMSSIKDPDKRRETYKTMAKLAMRTNKETTFLAAPAKPVPTFTRPENLDEIKQVIGSVKNAVDSHKPGEQYVFPETKCSLGFIAKERFDAIGIQPEDNVEAIFESPGKSAYGMEHWRDHHLKDWKRHDFEEYLLKVLSETIWNPSAKMENTLSTKGKRIKITSPDGKYIANFWRQGENWVYSIQDAWDWSKSGSKKI